MAAPSLLLASTSPRRLDLVRQLGIDPARVVGPDIDETPHKGELPRAYALRMAIEKACALPRNANEVTLAGDTVVAAGRRILPRAADAAEVTACLRLLSGRRHRVLSAIAVIDRSGQLRTRLSDTMVQFAPISDADIARYAASGDGEGKAGGYAVQGAAGAFVKRLDGSYSGVVGLPLYETRLLLRHAGFDI